MDELDKQELPNATATLVLGILSIVFFCCYGIIGLALGIIALVISNKSVKLFKEAPEKYKGYSNLNAGRICAIIGVILSGIYLLVIIIYLIAFGTMFGAMGGWEELMEELQNLE